MAFFPWQPSFECKGEIEEFYNDWVNGEINPLSPGAWLFVESVINKYWDYQWLAFQEIQAELSSGEVSSRANTNILLQEEALECFQGHFNDWLQAHADDAAANAWVGSHNTSDLFDVASPTSSSANACSQDAQHNWDMGEAIVVCSKHKQLAAL